jgi:hypothetical protein
MLRGGRGIGVLMSALVLAGIPATAAAQSPDPGFDFSGYRIPAQNWRSWFVNGAASGFSNTTSDFLASARFRTATGGVTTGLETGHDSDPLFYDARVNLNATGAGTFLNSSANDGADGRSFSDHNWSQRWVVDGSLRAYPWEPPIGFTASALASGSYAQDWQHQDLTSNGVSFPTEQSSRVYEYQVLGQVGAGVGRVRDAGNVYRAWLFERRLVRDGTLLRPLSPGARARLADLFTTEGGYAFAHQFPDKAFWSEVEKLLHEDGVLPDSGMAAYGLMHAMDPMVGGATYDARRIGWFVGPTLQGTHLHQLNDQSLNGFSNRLEASSDQVLAGVTGEYHRPIGIGWQIDLFANAWADVKGVRRGEMVLTGASVRYRFAERWLATLFGNTQRVLAREENPEDFWFVTVQSGVEYQLEDHWRLSLALRQDQYHQQANDYYYRQQMASLGVTWSWGRFDAPGLIAPVRPLPVGPP